MLNGVLPNRWQHTQLHMNILFYKYIDSKYLYIGHILPSHCFFRGGLSVGSPPNRFSNHSKFLIPHIRSEVNVEAEIWHPEYDT